MDRRIIENIKDYTKGIQIIEDLKPVQFNERGKEKTKLGLVSQDVQQVEPICISVKGQLQYVDYEQLSIIYLNAIKELKEEIEFIKSKMGNPSRFRLPKLSEKEIEVYLKKYVFSTSIEFDEQYEVFERYRNYIFSEEDNQYAGVTEEKEVEKQKYKTIYEKMANKKKKKTNE